MAKKGMRPLRHGSLVTGVLPGVGGDGGVAAGGQRCLAGQSPDDSMSGGAAKMSRLGWGRVVRPNALHHRALPPGGLVAAARFEAPYPHRFLRFPHEVVSYHAAPGGVRGLWE